MAKRVVRFLVLISVFLTPVMLNVVQHPASRAHAASYDVNNLINDPTFIDINSMSASDIQSFLNSKGSFLKDFSEGGRSAAQIIYDASHGHGQASGSAFGITVDANTGTVSPRVILTTLQKEQGLLTMVTRNDGSLNAAMGYGCPDSGGCDPKYAGFTNQVEWGAWQLRYNYEAGFKDASWRSTNYGSATFPASPGYPGQTVTIDSQSVTFANAATAALYRYTPHINSFYTLFTTYFVPYSYRWIDQNAYATVAPSGAYDFVLRVRNTGSSTWQKGTVNLATAAAHDRIPVFTREGPAGAGYTSGWISPNRIQFEESSVAPNAVATYSFWMRNDNVSPGKYREYFQAVNDGPNGQWMEDYGIYWEVTAVTTADAYHYQWQSQNAQPTQTISSLTHGQAYQFSVNLKNTGGLTWQKGVVNLGTSHSRDRIPVFTRESSDGSPSGWISPNRITMQQQNVPPGGTATYTFWMRNDNVAAGPHREYFQLVNDGPGGDWMEDYGIYWDVPTN